MNKTMRKNVQKISRSYFDTEFMKSTDARPLRILSEYFHPLKVFKKGNVEDTIVFFGSARAKRAVFLKNQTKKVVQKIPGANKDKQLSESYQAATKLAYRLTNWSKALPKGSKRFIICTGGGPGIMEAANRGAYLARGRSVGLNIEIPFEQDPNQYISRDLCFDFNYFFMRKYWFTYLAKALVVFPGGFGTCDELFEILTLVQTKKIKKPVPIVLYDKKFWNKLINFDLLVQWGTISKADLKYIYFAEDTDQAFEHITRNLSQLYLQKNK